jgi:hypothetical protein
MFGRVFWDFFRKNPAVKMGKQGKSGGGGHSVEESVFVLNPFLQTSYNFFDPHHSALL